MYCFWTGGGSQEKPRTVSVSNKTPCRGQYWPNAQQPCIGPLEFCLATDCGSHASDLSCGHFKNRKFWFPLHADSENAVDDLSSYLGAGDFLPNIS